MATQTLTHHGMNLVEPSSSFLNALSVATSSGFSSDLLVLGEDADRFRGGVHVVADVLHLVGRRLGERPVLLDLVGDLLHQHGERGIGAFGDLVRVDVVGDGRARIAEDVVAGAMRRDHLGGRLRRGDELRRMRLRHARG